MGMTASTPAVRLAIELLIHPDDYGGNSPFEMLQAETFVLRFVVYIHAEVGSLGRGIGNRLSAGGVDQ
jgi:hypothetical protein